jgi:ankyrin repeat protein
MASGRDLFEQLPIEALLHFFSFLRPQDYVSASRTFKNMVRGSALDIELFWREKFKRHFPHRYKDITKVEGDKITKRVDDKSWYKTFRVAYQEEYQGLREASQRELFSLVKESDVAGLNKANIHFLFPIMIRDSRGKSPLQWARDIGNPHVLLYFYNLACVYFGGKNIDFSMIDSYYRRNIFHYAVLFEQDEKCFDQLVQSIPRINIFPLLRLDLDGLAPIHSAIQYGRLDLVKLCLEKFPHLNMLELKTGLGLTPLMVAAVEGQTEIAAFLCGKGANQYAVDSQGSTALHLAVTNRRVETTTLLMKESLKVKAIEPEQLPATHVPVFAAREATAIAGEANRPKALPIVGDLARRIAGGQAGMLKRASERPPLALMRGANQELLVHVAVRSSQLPLVKAVVENYSDPLGLLVRSDSEGNQPIHIAVENEYVEIVEYFIQKRAWLDDYSEKTKKTPLHIACTRAYSGSISEQIALMLIQAGAKLDVKTNDDSQRLPIHLASVILNLALIKKMVEKQPDLMNRSDSQGFTPLILTVMGSMGFKMFVEYFLSKKTIALNSKTNMRDADGKPNHPDHGKTALRFSLEKKFDDISLLLIRAGASISDSIEGAEDQLVADIEGDRVTVINQMINEDPVAMLRLLDAAIVKKSERAIDFLLSKPAIREQLKNDSTVLLTAIRSAYAIGVHKLLKAGASVAIPAGNPPRLPFHFLISSYRILNVRWLELVSAMLDFDKQLVNQVDEKKATPLHVATRQNDISAVQFLLANGPLVDAINSENKTALSIALENGFSAIVKMLVESGASIALALAGLREHPIYRAVRNDQEELVALLLKHDPTLLEQGNPTLLLQAATQGGLGCVAYLLKHGASVIATANGMTALDLAVQEGHVNAARLLVTRGAKSAKKAIHHAMSLVRAGTEDAKLLVQEMVQRDPACVHQTNAFGETALSMAVQMGDFDLVNFLIIEGGAHLDVKINNPDSDDHGKTLLWLAVESGHVEIITLLTQLGAPMLAPRGEMQLMPIHYLIDKYLNEDDEDQKDIILLQIKAVVDHHPDALGMRDGRGRSPFLMASLKDSYANDFRLSRYLLEKGANVNDASNYPDENRDKTPLLLAAEKGKNEMCRMLLEFGAHSKMPINHLKLDEDIKGAFALLDYEKQRAKQGQYKRHLNLFFTKIGLGCSRERKLAAVAALKQYSFFTQNGSVENANAWQDLKKYKKELNNGELKLIRRQMGVVF